MADSDIAGLRGSLCAIVTPFRDGALDIEALRRFVSWQIEQGTQGLVPCGTTGESPVLSGQEWETVLKTVLEETAGRVPVLAGTGTNNTAQTIERTLHAQNLGATAAMIVTPYYNKPGQDGLLAHYTAIHDATAFPLIPYNVPSRTNVTIEVPTLARLAELPRIVGVKDATGDVARVNRQRDICGDEFIQLCGEDPIALGFNGQGGHGCISVTANVAPKACAELQKASLEGDFAAAQALQDMLMPLHDALFCETSPQPVKFGVSRLGLCSDEVRLPLVPASSEARKRVEAAMSHAGLI